MTGFNVITFSHCLIIVYLQFYNSVMYLTYFLKSATISTDFLHLGPEAAMMFNERLQLLLVIL